MLCYIFLLTISLSTNYEQFQKQLVTSFNYRLRSVLLYVMKVIMKENSVSDILILFFSSKVSTKLRCGRTLFRSLCASHYLSTHHNYKLEVVSNAESFQNR